MRCRMRSQVPKSSGWSPGSGRASHAGRLLPARPSLDLCPPQLGGAHQPGRASPRRASPALHQVPLQSRSPGQVPGSPTSHFPWVPSLGKSPTHRQAAGWRDGEPLAVNPTRVWGVGPRATLARATDNTTHGLAIPARSVAQSLSPPHRATQRLSLLGDPSTHPTGGQGHREAGRQATGQAGPAQTMSLTHRGERGEERGVRE